MAAVNGDGGVRGGPDGDGEARDGELRSPEGQEGRHGLG